MSRGDNRSAKDERTEALLTHGDALLRYATLRVPNPETAEDLVQDTLVTAVQKVAEYKSESSLRTWLIGILRHKILDHYRWRERHPADLPGDADTTESNEDLRFTKFGAWRFDPNQGLSVLDTPEGSAERSELRAAIRLCIEHLPRRLHRIFVLREVEELEPKEVCHATGISLESLTVLIYRARQSLRACLQRIWV